MADIVLKDVTTVKDCVRILRGFVCSLDDEGERALSRFVGQRYWHMKVDLESVDLMMWRILSLPPKALENFISVLNAARELVEADEKEREARVIAEVRTFAKLADDDFEDRLSRFSQFENNPKEAPKKMG
jgi:hypothetical protein